MLGLSLVALLGVSAAAAPDAPFAPLQFLAGHCWRATLADGTSTDTHCFERLYAPHFLRDRHAVCADGKRVYAGETTYLRAPDGKGLAWRYLSSAGLVMDGRLETAPAALRFSGSYADAGGTHEVRATWTPGKDSYRAVTEALQPDGSWKQQSDAEFVRVDAADACAAG